MLKQLQKNIFLGENAATICIILIVLAGLAVYSNSLNNRFVWDDAVLVQSNLYITDWSNLPKIFSCYMGEGFAYKRFSDQWLFYRPLQTLTHMADYSIWKMVPGGYRITNILFHILSALAAFLFIDTIFHDKTIAFFTAILFVISPLQTETVNYISGRSDSMALFFMLLSFIFYIKVCASEKNRLFAAFSVAMYLLALLSKENSLTLIPLLIAYHYVFKKDIPKKLAFSLILATFMYIILRVAISKYPMLDLFEPETIVQRMPGFFVAVTNYLRLLLVPIGLHMDYGQGPFSIAHPKAVSGLILTMLLLSYAFVNISRDKMFSFSILWFFLTLLPVSNILFPLPFYMSEHYLYAPSLAFFLILGRVLTYIYRSKRYVLVSKILVGAIFISYASMTLRQNNFWESPESLYKRILQFNTGSFNAYNNLGVEYEMKGDSEKAINCFREGIEHNPEEAILYKNMGDVYRQMGDTSKAARYYKRAIELYPDYAEVYMDLALLFLNAGNRKEGIQLCRKALAINPDYGLAHNNLAIAYFYEKRYDLAIIHCDKAIGLGFKVNPHFIEALKPFRQKQKE